MHATQYSTVELSRVGRCELAINARRENDRPNSTVSRGIAVLVRYFDVLHFYIFSKP